MATSTVRLPRLGTQAGFRRFSIAEYHRLTELGILTEDDNLERIDGYLVLKMPGNPPTVSWAACISSPPAAAGRS